MYKNDWFWIALIATMGLFIIISHSVVRHDRENVGKALIEAIETKEIPIDSFDNLSDSNKKKFLEIGGKVSPKNQYEKHN